MLWTWYAIYGLALIAIYLFFVPLFFDLLLRGFAPFMPSRPWVVETLLKTMKEMNLPQGRMVIVALSTGRSGFVHRLEKEYPEAEIYGYEPSIFPYMVARIQVFLRRSRIKVRYSKIHRINVKQADFIYCHLYPDNMKSLGSKLKFECRSGTKIISTGFLIPYLDFYEWIALEDRKAKFDFLSKNQKLFQKKNKKFKKEKKAYLYEI